MKLTSRKKNVLFLVYYCFITFLMCFPGPFDWANRIEPWILGLPFAAFYLFACVALLCGGLIVQYLIEDKMGEMDVDVNWLTTENPLNGTVSTPKGE